MGVFCMNGGGIAISLSCVVVVKPWVYISCTCPCGGVFKSEVAGEGSKPLCVELGEKFETRVLSVRKEESTRFRLAARRNRGWGGGYLVRNCIGESWGVIDRSVGQICRSDLAHSLPVPTTLLFPVEGRIVE